jgi:hypothetical protein
MTFRQLIESRRNRRIEIGKMPLPVRLKESSAPGK